MIKEATLDDVPEIVALWSEFMDEHEGIVVKENPELEEMEIKDSNKERSYEEFITSHIKSPDGKVFLAEEQARIIGYILIYIKDEIPIFKNKKVGYISDLYVKKEFRGRGISSQLRDKALEWFRKKGMRFISIGLYCDNRYAHSMYKRWGFMDYKVEVRRKL